MSLPAKSPFRHFSGLPFVRAALVAVIIAPVILSPPAWSVGLDIDVVYDSGKSNAPANDASGTDLTAIIEAAAAHWADLIEDDWDMKINVWYDTPAAVGGATAIAPIVTDNTDGTRTIEGNIIFNNAPVNLAGMPLQYFFRSDTQRQRRVQRATNVVR